MYSISRRKFCRCAFVLLGILPLLVTVVIAGWRNRQFDADHFASLISRVSGCRTTVADVTFVRPGTVRLEQVRFEDAETGELFLFLPRVDVHRDDQGVCLEIPQAHVQDSAGDRVLFLVHERVLRQPDLLAAPIFVTIDQIQFGRRRLDTHEPAGTTRFVENRFELRQFNQGSELRGQLRQPDSTTHHSIELTIRRTLGDLPATTIALQTHDHWLTANLLVGEQRWLPQLSASTRFRGNLHIDVDASGWSGEVFGEFEAVDLGQLVGDRFDRFLTGQANALVRTARFANSRVQEIDADIHAGPGDFGTRQLKAAAEIWQLRWSETPELGTASIAYERLSTLIYLTEKGVELAGLCEGNDRTLLTLPAGKFLGHPEVRFVSVPVPSIVGVLLPAEPSPQFHISAEVDSLLRVLPLPPANTEDPSKY